MPEFESIRRQCVALLGGVLLAGAAACSSPSGEACASDSDCRSGYECVSTGGVLFGDSLCLLDESAPADTSVDAGDTAGAADVADTSDASPTDVSETDIDAPDARVDADADTDAELVDADAAGTDTDVEPDTCTGSGCDIDTDGDGIVDSLDGCPEQPNADQLDRDGDGTQDACDPQLTIADADATFPGIRTICCSDVRPWRVAGGGDLTGDGVDDAVVSGYRNDSFYVWVISAASSPRGTIALAAAHARLRVPGEGPYGLTLANLGDVNGDGTADLLVGHPGFNADGGRAYLFYGGADLRGDLTTGDADAEFWENGEDRVGFAVEIAPDVDADGIDEVVIGEVDGGADQQGRVHVFFGGANLPVSTQILPNSGADIRLVGQAGQRVSWSLAGVGDVNGDGYGDVLVGAPYDGNEPGEAVLVAGGPRADVPSLPIGTVGITYHAPASQPSGAMGMAVSAAGDVNGDGFADFLMGAPTSTTPGGDTDGGAAYLVLGSASIPERGDSLNVEDVAITYHGQLQNDLIGGAVSAAGDVNMDGLGDFLVGAPAHTVQASSVADAGAVYLVHGSAQLGAQAQNKVDITAMSTVFLGSDAQDYNGFSVAGGSDLDGDGRHELLMTAPGYDTSSADVGAAFLFYGL